MKLSKNQLIIIFVLFIALVVAFFVWQQMAEPSDQNTAETTTPEQRDEQFLQENKDIDEDKLCRTIDDCVIVSSGGECPQQAAFYKDAIDAHRQFITSAADAVCPTDEPSGTAQLACQNNQCQIKYSVN